MMRRLILATLGALLAMGALAQAVRAGDLAGDTSLATWSGYSESWRAASINGVMATMNSMGMQCQRNVTVGEVHVAVWYGYRAQRLDGEKPWIVFVLATLSADYGCRVNQQGLGVFVQFMNNLR